MKFTGKDKETRRREILRTARRLILKVGYEKVSLRTVARESRYSPSALYEYFAGKEEILQNVRQEILAEMADALRNAATRPDSLQAICQAYIEFGLSHAQEYLLVFFHAQSGRRGLAQASPRGSAFHVLHQRVTEVAEEEAWSFQDGLDPEQVAYGLWALVHGQVMLQLTHLKYFEADFRQTDPALIRQFIRGFR
jgi:AcrR family transcriptional regulator